jgi:hypothetical protein
MSRLRDYGLLTILAAPFRALWRLLVGRVPFCPWPGCWNRVDPTCSGVMYGRPDEHYCAEHCRRWHRDRGMAAIGLHSDCPRSSLRVVKG